jgi:hypothetical protein
MGIPGTTTQAVLDIVLAECATPGFPRCGKKGQGYDVDVARGKNEMSLRHRNYEMIF